MTTSKTGNKLGAKLVQDTRQVQAMKSMEPRVDPQDFVPSDSSKSVSSENGSGGANASMGDQKSRSGQRQAGHLLAVWPD